MKYILPNQIPEILRRNIKVNELDGTNYLISFQTNDHDSFITTTKPLSPRGKSYLIKLGILKPYEHIKYNIESILYPNENILSKFVNFRVIVDRSIKLSLIQFLDYEQLPYSSKDNIPTNAYATTYNTITYSNLEYRNVAPGDNLHYNFNNHYYHYFSGYVKPRNDIRIIYMNENFRKLNNHCGYFDINGIRVYIITKFIFYGEVYHDYEMKFNNITITEIENITLNIILSLFVKFYISPIIKEEAIYGKDNNTFMFIGKIENSPFLKYLKL